MKQLNSGKAPGPDTIPAEQYKHSAIACEELYQFITAIWESEDIPEEFVIGEMMMINKKMLNDD